MPHTHPLTYSLAFRAIANGPILLSLDFSFDGRRIARSQTASADAKAMAHAQRIWTYLEYPSNPVVANAAIDALGQETIDALDELIAELADHDGLTARLDRLIYPKLGLLPCKLIEFLRASEGAEPEGWDVRGAEELLGVGA